MTLQTLLALISGLVHSTCVQDTLKFQVRTLVLSLN